MLPEARARGYKAGRFSFNVKGGRCETCQGDGVIAIEMHFLPNVYVTCEECKGRRYNRETLEIKYRGKSIAEMLDLTVDQALELVENFPPIALRSCARCRKSGSATSSWASRRRRCRAARRSGSSCRASSRGAAPARTLYILDEPTTGLHFEDVRRLLEVLGKLVDQGNTIVVIEHNLDVIKSADWVIDLGPEGGARRRQGRRGRAAGGGRARAEVGDGAVPGGRARDRAGSAERQLPDAVWSRHDTRRLGLAVVKLTRSIERRQTA